MMHRLCCCASCICLKIQIVIDGEVAESSSTWVDVGTIDCYGDQDDYAPFTRFYRPLTNVVVSAPSSFGTGVNKRWRLGYCVCGEDGQCDTLACPPRCVSTETVTVTMPAEDTTPPCRCGNIDDPERCCITVTIYYGRGCFITSYAEEETPVHDLSTYIWAGIAYMQPEFFKYCDYSEPTCDWDEYCIGCGEGEPPYGCESHQPMSLSATNLIMALTPDFFRKALLPCMSPWHSADCNSHCGTYALDWEWPDMTITGDSPCAQYGSDCTETTELIGYHGSAHIEFDIIKYDVGEVTECYRLQIAEYGSTGPGLSTRITHCLLGDTEDSWFVIPMTNLGGVGSTCPYTLDDGEVYTDFYSADYDTPGELVADMMAWLENVQFYAGQWWSHAEDGSESEGGSPTCYSTVKVRVSGVSIVHAG